MSSVFRLIWHRTLSRMGVASESARSQHKAGSRSQRVGQVREASGQIYLNALRPVTFGIVLACPAVLVPLSISKAEARAFASPANNADECTSGVTTTGATVGNLATPETDALPIDGSGTYSTVAGCNANGNNQLAMSVYGAFGEGTGRGASAFGFNSQASQWATAIGLETRATGQASTALGFGSQASGIASIAIGRGAQSEAENAIAIGYNAQAAAKNTISIGTGNEVNGEGSGAIGDPNFVSGNETYVYGNNNGTNMAPIAADNAGILGSNNAMTDTADGSFIMGSNNDIDVANAMVFGNKADVTKEGGVALGSGAFAETEADIAGYAPVNATRADITNIGTTVATNAAVDVGSRQITSVAAGTALDDAVNVSQLIAVENMPLMLSADSGADVKRKLGETLSIEGNPTSALTTGNIGIESNGTDTLIIKLAKDVNLGADGSLTIVGGPGLSSTGIDAGDLPVSNVDDAVTDDQAVNFGQLKNFDFGDVMEYYSVNSTDTDVGSNVNNDSATGINAMAAGPNASATGDNATAIGNLSSASNAGATAIGFNASALGANSFALGEASSAIGESSLAQGAGAKANTRYTTALGSGTFATGQGAIALGGGTVTDAARATGAGAIAIGGYGAAGSGGANANVNYSVALGSGAQAGASEGDVALGSGSQTAMANPVTSAAIGDTIHVGFAGTAPTSVVSVGSAGEERQITNVAAGRITATSTDAINGSQLFSVVDNGFNLSDENGANTTIQLGDTVNYTNDDGNVVVTLRDNEIIYDLASKLSGLQEVAITHGPTINNAGIDMGDKSITNLGSGLKGIPIDEVEGEALGNAVNAGDLQDVTRAINQGVAAATTEVEAGLSDNMTITDRSGADGQTIYTVDTADQVSFTGLEVGSIRMDAGNVDESGDSLISGIGAGNVSEDSKDAINGSQLYNVINSGDFSTRYVNTNDTGLTPGDSFAEGQGATAVGYDARSEGEQSLALGYQAMAAHQGSVALGANASTLAADEVVERTTSITIGAETYPFAGAGKGVVSTVSVGEAGGERTISNMAAGRISETSTDAINGSQLYAATQYMEALDGRLARVESGLGDISETMPGELAPDSPDVNSNQLNDLRQDVADNTSNIAGNTQGVGTNSDNIIDIGNTVDQGFSFGADQGEPVNRKLGDTVAITGDDNITMRTTGDGVQVMLNRELDVDTVIAGNTTINNKGVRIQDGPSMTVDGFDANGTTITNVAPGVNAGDAVNVRQMDALGQHFAQKIGDVHSRIDDVARDASAGIASVAAMGNAPYVPGKLTYHVGGGHHNGESAVGVNFRRTADNGRWSLSAGFAGSRAGPTIGVGIAGVID